jgi:hypothetical protein
MLYKIPPVCKTLEEKKAYALGMINGAYLYAWMKDGTTYVGTCGSTYKEAVERIKAAFNEETGEKLNWEEPCPHIGHQFEEVK